MSRFIITKENKLIDLEWFGFNTMFVGMTQESVIKKKKYYYYHSWTPGNEYIDDLVYEFKIDVKDEFDSLKEVERKYKILSEPDELPDFIEKPRLIYPVFYGIVTVERKRRK